MNTEELIRCIQEHPKNQTQIGEDIGFNKSKMSRLTNGANIDSADTKLLRLYFYGETPFGAITQDLDLKHTLRFTHTEWQIITILAHRQGFRNPQSWITAQIRAYLQHNSEAEDISPVYQSKPIPPILAAEATLAERIDSLKNQPGAAPKQTDGNGKNPPAKN